MSGVPSEPFVGSRVRGRRRAYPDDAVRHCDVRGRRLRVGRRRGAVQGVAERRRNLGNSPSGGGHGDAREHVVREGRRLQT